MTLKRLIFALFLQVLLLLFLLPPSMAVKVVDSETEAIGASLGWESEAFVRDKSSAWTDAIYYESGFYRAAYKLVLPSEEEKARSTGLENLGEYWFEYIEGRFEALEEMLKLSMLRASLILIWLPYIVILLVPAVVDGYLNRKIKQTTFQYSSPIIYHYATKFVGLVMVGSLIAFLLPVPFNPLIIPAVLVLVSVALGAALGNFQKRF